MDMLMGGQIAAANLTDWRKLAQGLHARYAVEGFGAAARFVTAVGVAGDAIGHHPRVTIGRGYVDLDLVSPDAIYRDDDDGTELVLKWVTQQDIDLARQITAIAADHGLTPEPSSVSEVELGLDTTDSASIAPVWAALLTGSADSQGWGHRATRSVTPRCGCPISGSATSRTRRHRGGTSRCTWHPRWSSNG